MERNQSKRTFNKVHGKTNAILNKKESSHIAKSVREDTEKARTDESIKLSSTMQLKKIFIDIAGWFGFGTPKRDTIRKPIPKKTNKEMKQRSPEVRAKRNTARNSRKTNGHRGPRKGK